jgi:hypothetical protein
MLQALDRPHVLRAFERARIGAALLAHAALHLMHGFVFVPLHPISEAAFHVAQVIDPVPQQGRTKHGDVGAHHQEFDRILRIVYAAGGCQARLHAAVQDPNPG